MPALMLLVEPRYRFLRVMNAFGRILFSRGRDGFCWAMLTRLRTFCGRHAGVLSDYIRLGRWSIVANTTDHITRAPIYCQFPVQQYTATLFLGWDAIDASNI